MNPMLQVKGLFKSFGGRAALRNVFFEVEQGEIHGLLGHNGAGKSTSLGIILGMVEPDRGEAFIGGVSVQKNQSKALRKVGAIFESPSFYEYLSGWENLRILASYSGGFDAKYAKSVVERVGLTDAIRHKVRQYSHGMRQRLALAQALIPEPEILLLDEPTDGLDPEGIKWFREFILDLREEEGTTVLFNSHLLSEVELMCDRVTILKKGEVVHEGKVSDLRGESRVYQADFEPWHEAAAFLQFNGVQVLDGNRVLLPPDADPAIMVAALVGVGIRVSSFAPIRKSLEDVYLEITSTADGAAGPESDLPPSRKSR